MNEIRDVLDRMREVNECFFEEEWSDGLPVIPPTPDGVEWMLRGTQRDRHELIGTVAPGWGKATVERIAINGLMAGCRPEYMPVLVAAVQAVTDGAFLLQGGQGTTDGVAPLLIINGPVTERLGFEGGTGCFGNGRRANATVGRSINLIFLTLGGAIPGRIKKSTLSQPGTYSYCIAESPSTGEWEPFHVERGFAPDASTVTAFPALPMSQVADDCNATAEGFLTSLCDTMAVLGNCALYRGSETVVTFPPELVAVLQREGWSKQDVKRHIHANARRSVRDLRRGGEWNKEVLIHLPPDFDLTNESTTIPAVHRPDDLHVVVAGGETGRWMALIPGWGYGSHAVTVPIES